MKIKTFTAESVASALKQVRREMGSEATVLRTRQVTNKVTGHRLEITACVDDSRVTHKASASSTLSPAEAPIPNQVTVLNQNLTSALTKNGIVDENIIGLGDRLARLERKIDRILSVGLPFHSDQYRLGDLDPVYERLKNSDLPLAYIESFMNALLEEYGDHCDVMTAAHERLCADVSTIIEPRLKFKPNDRVLFIGPAGAGKTSVMGKLAARLVMQLRQKVTLACLEFHRMAAHEELAGYAEILQTRVADSLEEIEKESKNGDTITLIDAPPVPTNPEKLEELKTRVRRIKPTHCVAVFSALTRTSDVGKLSAQVGQLEPTHLAVTMLDLTDCYGSILAGASALGIKLAFVTDSPGGEGDTRVPDPNKLARVILSDHRGTTWTSERQDEIPDQSRINVTQAAADI